MAPSVTQSASCEQADARHELLSHLAIANSTEHGLASYLITSNIAVHAASPAGCKPG
jgi:hypothetical protein